MPNRLLFLIALFIAAIILVAAPTATPAQAQTTPQTCQETVQAALEALTANCTGVGRNTACYANVQVDSTFTQPVPEGYFSQPADLADIVDLQTLTTSPMDEAQGVWGVALMNVQANLPGTLPGQSVTLLLLGDTVVGNAVPADEAALPVAPVPVLSSEPADIVTLPETGAEVAGSVPASTTMEADARTADNQWVRVAVLREPQTDSFGGWIQATQLVPFDLGALPVVTADTRTPMQAFVFRTGIGQPTCSEAPNSVVVQGPNNTQVLMNVNGADLTIGSTVQLTSVEGAPDEILDNLDLPDDVVDQLNNANETDETACGVMQMSVLSGAVDVNDGTTTLPAGNSAFAVVCGEEPPPSDNPESTPEPGLGIGFTSEWGSFQPMTEQELEQASVLENVGDDVLNYQIVLPAEDEIQPPISNTPTPLPPLGGPVTLTPTPTPTVEPSPTPNPTIPPGTGLSAGITINAAVNNQAAGVGQPFPVPFSVRITDPYGGPSIGVPVTFTAPASGASGTFAATGTNTQTVNTDSSGNATASTFTTNTIAGSFSVTISAPRDVGFFALSERKGFARPALQTDLISSISATNLPGAPALISAAAGGSGLSATVNTTYSAQPAALVTDIYGNPVPFVPVTFTVVPGGSGAGGTFSGQPTANGATGFDGIATAPFLTANTVAGAFTVTADGSFANTPLSMTNLPDVPAALTAQSGSGQTATVATSFGSTLNVRVTDTYGNGVPGQSVTFTGPGSGASATFASTGTTTESSNTDSSGFASSSALTANTIAGGPYTVTATSGAFSDSFSLTNTAGAPATITVTGGNGQSATINTAYGSPLSVSVVDAYSNPAAGASVTFTPPGSGASLIFSGSSTVTANGAGQATSPAMTANNTAGNYAVSVASGAASNSFSLTNLNPQPVITSITPASATAGGAGFTLSIGGTGFVPGMQVTWTGQSALTATVGSSTSATVNIPAGYIASAGTPSVGVTNPGPGGGASAGTLTFTVNPATVVTNLNDSGPGSLRSVIANVPAGSTISFAVSGTIALSTGPIRIDKDLTLNGTNPYTVTISGNNTNQIFVITDPGVDVAIFGLRFINGNAGGGDGGAFYVSNGATLNFQYSVMEGNIAGTSTCCGKGGAMFVVNATVIIFNSSLKNNTAGTDPSNNYGGALALFSGGSITVTQSCLTGNSDPSNQAIQNFTGSTINATDNWWGDAGGPGSNGANTVSSGVDASSFRAAPVPSVVGC